MMEDVIKSLLREYFEFQESIKPTNIKFGPFNYKDRSFKDRKRLNFLREKVEENLDKLNNEQLSNLLLAVEDIRAKRWIRAIIRERDSHEKIQQGWFYRLGLIPTFTEVNLFLMGFIFLLLLFFDIVFLEQVLDFIFDDFNFRSLGAITFFLIGLGMSIYHSFSNKRVSRTSKGHMLFFAIIINFMVGFLSGLHMLTTTKGFALILPSINIISATLLISLYRSGKITTTSILNKQAKLKEVILGAAIVVAIFIVSQHIFQNHWTITFSMCLIYATNIGNFINKWIFLSKTRFE